MKLLNKGLPWGVLFDLDGVLVDSEREYTRIWNKINSEFPTNIDNFAEKIKGTTPNNILSAYYPGPEVRKRVETRLYEEEALMVYEYCQGAEELLKDLKKNNIPVALFTSSNKIKMAHLYKNLPEIRNYFDFIVTGEMVEHSKPDPEGYVLAAEKLGLDSKNCLVVEDSLQGVKAGKATGGKVLGVAGTLPAEVISGFSDRVVNSLKGVSTKELKEMF